MILAARASALSLVVHAVEGAGAVCGARPKDGRWRLSTRLPVSCPRCLLALAHPRYAFCRVPMPSTRNDVLHLRRVGLRGVKPRQGIDTLTLCGRQPSVDVGLAVDDSDMSSGVCRRCAREHVLETRPGLDPAHAVR